MSHLLNAGAVSTKAKTPSQQSGVLSVSTALQKDADRRGARCAVASNAVETL